MKKITLLLALFAFVFAANAQVLYDETFDYANVGGPLGGQGGWTEAGGIHSNGEGRTIVSPALTYSDGAGSWALSSMGNTFKMYDVLKSTAENYVYKPFVSTPITSGILYVSFLFQSGTISSTNTEVFGLANGTSAGPKVMIKKVSSTTFNFGVTRGQAATAAYKYGTTTLCNTGTTYFVVMKYDFTNVLSNGIVSVFVNPALASAAEPTTPEVSENTSTTIQPQLNNMWQRNQTSGANSLVSGVRISTSWAAAVGLPATPLSFPTNLSTENISNNGFTAKWTPVANASSYDVAVFDGTTQVKAINVLGQATSSAAITGLKSNTAYTFTVVAKGDGINFASSGSSLALAFNTTGLTIPVVLDVTAIGETSFTANWAAVPDAIGYELNLYIGSALVSTVSADGQSSSTHQFSSLISGTTYKYTVTAKGSTSNLNSTASTTTSATTTFPFVNSVNTDFSDGSWGTITPTPTTNLPSNGMYPSGSINGFALSSCAMYGLMVTGPRGEEHVNVIRMDKMAFGAAVITPVINSVARLELHVSGSDTKTFTVKQWNAATSTWDLISVNGGTFTIVGAYENVFKIELNNAIPTQYKIENASTSSISIVQIKTYPTLPTAVELTIPTGIGAATNLVAGGFTASWTPVANASGYLVTVLNYGSYLHKTFTVTGQSTSSCNVIGLDSATVCTYQVAAVGDGIAFSNSLLSVSSTSFSITAGLLAVNNPTMSSTIWSNGKNIHVPEIGKIEVYNLQGVRLLCQANTNILCSKLESGVYVIKFTNPMGRVYTNKVCLY